MNKLKNLLLPFLVVCALIFSFKVAIVPTYAEHQKPPNTEENNKLKLYDKAVTLEFEKFLT